MLLGGSRKPGSGGNPHRHKEDMQKIVTLPQDGTEDPGAVM